MSDALAKVKTDLGRGAVILHTRTIRRGGFLGLGARSFVEITATADARVAAVRGAAGGSSVVRPTPPDASAKTAAVVSGDGATSSSVERAAPGPGVAARQTEQAPETALRSGARSARVDRRESPASQAAPAGDPVLRSEVREIRAMVMDLVRQTQQSRRPKVPDELLESYSHLISQDVAEELVAQLLDRVADTLRDRGTVHWDDHGRLVGGEPSSESSIRQELQQALAETLPPAAPLQLTDADGPTVVAMVGPTGVGKTTTIAKLAANMKLREGKRVGLITIDTFRIAAIEQLKTYAQILQVPLVAVTTPDEMRPAIQRMSDADLILIDTAGRSQKDAMRIAELAGFLSAARPDQVHLVLSSTSREEAIREAVRNFSVLGPRHLVFTKLDEAVGFGVILNVLRSVDLRLSYLTHGQSVPADIEAGSPRRVAELVLGPAAGSTSAQPGSASSPVVAAERRGA